MGELKAQLRDAEHETARLVAEKDAQIVALKEKYVDCMRSNTAVRHNIVDVSQEKKVFEISLRKGQSAMFADDSSRAARQRKEMRDLQKLSQLQAQEIVRLRTEIEALGKKSG